jgi:cell wall assembly regulator SMI1
MPAMTLTEQIHDAMRRIRAWCGTNGDARLVFACMNPPATDADLDAVEAKIGLKLPEDVRALYRICNGQDENAEANEDGLEVGLFPWTERVLAHLLYPLEEVASSTSTPQEPRRMPGFVVGWVPIASNYGGDEVVIDLSPDSPRPGRVLNFASSLAAHLTDIADKMEAGKIEFDEEEGLNYVDAPGFPDEGLIYDSEAFPD